MLLEILYLRICLAEFVQRHCIRKSLHTLVGATLINDGALISEVAAPQAVLYDPQCSGEEPKIVDCPNLIPAPTVEGDLVGCPYAAVSCRKLLIDHTYMYVRSNLE